MSAEDLPSRSGASSSTLLNALRCGFLFNHDQLHQIAHSAPIAFELIRNTERIDVVLLASSRSEEHTSELQSLMRISYAVFCLHQKKDTTHSQTYRPHYLPN